MNAKIFLQDDWHIYPMVHCTHAVQYCRAVVQYVGWRNLYEICVDRTDGGEGLVDLSVITEHHDLPDRTFLPPIPDDVGILIYF